MHSPGPWKAIIQKPSSRNPGGTLMVNAGGTMAIDCTNSGATFDECADNVRLIAQAPALFASLYDIVSMDAPDNRKYEKGSPLDRAYRKAVKLLSEIADAPR